MAENLKSNLIVGQNSYGSDDASISRSGAGEWQLGDGSGGASGTLNLATLKPTAGITVGGGTSPTAQATAVNSHKFINVRLRNTGTGDNRFLYAYYYNAKSDSGGECARFVNVCESTGHTGSHGVHASLTFGTGATQSASDWNGALRGTVQVPNNATTCLGGNSPVIAEVYHEGASSSIPTASNQAMFRALNSGNATAVAATDLKMSLFALDGFTVGVAGTGNMIDAISGDKAVTHLCRITVGGTPYYLMLRNAV